MAGIALLLPDANMVALAQKLLDQQPGNHVIYVKETSIKNVVTEARDAIEQGANILVARGHQARHLHYETNVPIVEITLTAQELGMMVVKAKKILAKKHPIIGICAWKGMLCDTSRFDELFGVTVHAFDMDGSLTVEEEVDRAMAQGVDILISGDKVVGLAKQRGIPALYIDATAESLEIALGHAETLYYMSEVEKHNYAQFSTVLDSSFSGIIKLGETGRVMLMNHVMEKLLGVAGNQTIGTHITKLIPTLDRDVIEEILAGKRDSYSAFLNFGKAAVVVVIEPILVENKVEGAILSCNQMKRLQRKDQDPGFLHGYMAHGTLDGLVKRMPGLKQVVETAKLHAGSAAPILVLGQGAEDVDELCQGIHNYSLRRDAPYVAVNLSGISEEQQMRLLFGHTREDGSREEGLMDKAQYGTLVIRSADKLTLQAQYHLLRVMNRRRLAEDRMDHDSTSGYDVRVICCTSKNLRESMLKNRMRRDFYFLLQTFRIEIPDLFDRKEDAERLLENSFQEVLATHARFHILSPGAKRAILEYDWQGHRLQLEAFVERMVLTVGKRTISEEYVLRLLDDLYGMEDEPPAQALPKASEDGGELGRIRQAMLKFNGNRSLMARELSMSTTTLWRRMKKYGLL